MTTLPDAIDLPQVETCTLPPQRLSILLEEIRACATGIEIRVRPADAGTEVNNLTLDDVESLLRTRTVKSVQIRYRYSGRLWMDTLIRHENEVRIVRIRHDDPYMKGESP